MVPGKGVSVYFFFNLLISISTYVLEVFSYLLALLYIYETERESNWFWTLIFLVAFSILATQVVSLYWSLWKTEICSKCGCFAVIFYVLLHVFQLGVVYRYARLVFCRDVLDADQGIADASMLRLFHAFSGGLPCLFITSYMVIVSTAMRHWQILFVVATGLLSNSWALASFRRQGQISLDIDSIGKVVPAAITKLMWRVGELGSRVMAVVLFAMAYHYWVFFVLALHWTVVFIWLFVLDVLDRKTEKNKRLPLRNLLLSIATAFIHIFCFLNVQVSQPRYKFLCFYIVTFSENVILFVAWVLNDGYNSYLFWFSVIIIASGMVLALVSMVFYHKYFHLGVRVSTNSAAHDQEICINCKLSVCVKHEKKTQRPFNVTVRFAEAYLKRRGSFPFLSESSVNKTANNYVDYNDMLQRRSSEGRMGRVNIQIKGGNSDINNPSCFTSRSLKEDKRIENSGSQEGLGAISRLPVNQGYLREHNCSGNSPEAPQCFSKGQNQLSPEENSGEIGNTLRLIRPLVNDNGISTDAGETCNDVSGNNLDLSCASEGHTDRNYSKHAGSDPDDIHCPRERQVRSSRAVPLCSVHSYRSQERRVAPLGSIDGDNDCTDNEIPTLSLPEDTDYPIYDYPSNRHSEGSDSEHCMIECDTTFTHRSSEEELSHYVKNFSFSAFSQSPETISRLRVSNTDSGVGESRVQSNIEIPQYSGTGSLYETYTSETRVQSTTEIPQNHGTRSPYETYTNTICSDSGPRQLCAAGARSRQSILSLGLSFRSIYDSLSVDSSPPLITTPCATSSNNHLNDSLTMVTSISTVNDVTCDSAHSGHFSKFTCENRNSIFGESSFDRSEYSTILASADHCGHVDYFEGCSKISSVETGNPWYECITTDTDISHIHPLDSEFAIYENPAFLLGNHESIA